MSRAESERGTPQAPPQYGKEKQDMDNFDANRTFMKSGFDVPGREFISEQERGLPPPCATKTMDGKQKIIDLPAVDESTVSVNDLYACLNNRRSRRNYQDVPLRMEELSFLLWATQGVQRVIPAYKNTGHITLRPVPSAGGRHSSETYLAVNHVAGLESGIYLYLPLEHRLAFCHSVDGLPGKLVYAYGGEEEADEARWLARASGAAPVPLQGMCRRLLTHCLAWMVKTNTWFIWPPWAR